MTNTMYNYNYSLHRNKGLSLVEVLVGMVIGLIGIVIIMQVYLVNENFKRTTTSAGSAQINGSISLYSIERDVMTAGYGISNNEALDCGTLRYHYSGTYSSPPGPAGGALQSITVAPVVIADGGATNPDTITVMYASAEARIVPATVAINMANPSVNLRVDNITGFSETPGDLIVVASAANCTLMQITSRLPGPQELVHVNTATLWNPVGGGSLTAHNAGAKVFNLGKPTVNIYSINASKLQQRRVFTWPASNVVPSYNTTATTLADDIVDMKAQYGKDTNGDGIVDTYDKTLPTTAAQWKQVLAIRLAVLARSQNYEKTPTGACTATTVQPRWTGSTAQTDTTTPPTNPVASPFVNITPLPNCYTYKVLESIIPLRNMIWSRT